MKRTSLLSLLVLALTTSSVPMPTATPLPPATAALLPTLALAPAPAIPIIDVGGLQVPDPRVTNPELIPVTGADSPVVKFASAFGTKPDEAGPLTLKPLTGVDGIPFAVLTTGDLASTPEYDETGTPLLIAEKGSSGGLVWTKATLRKIADKVGMPIGSLLELQQPKGLDIGKEEFSIFSRVNVSWMWREKSQGAIDFSGSDKQNQFANQNHMLPIAQHLVMTEELPDWVRKGNFSNEQLIALLKKHIHDTMSHYPDLKIWSVVNEAASTHDPNVDFWYSKLGKDYIKIAFEAARQEDPSAILCYSDLRNEVPGETATWNHEIVRMLKESNLIDGLMMHMRIDGAKPPKKDDLVSMMRSYGIPIYITELTVDLTGVSGTQEERFLHQAEVYRTIMEAAIESGVTKSFVMWGIGDSANWLETDLGQPQADPTIYNDDLTPKPAYYALLQAMLKYATQP